MNVGDREVRGAKARYELLTLLARGGMAEIWLARQEGSPEMKKYVVMKKILPHLARDKDFREMFVDEARITSRFDHPNVVRIHEISLDTPDLFLVLEYLEGESLAFVVSAAMERGGVMPPMLVAGIMAQVSDALDYAHKLCGEDGKSLGIVHRDISPQNIILLYTGQVKLVDFGVAKAVKKIHQTQSGMMKGKAFYMSPEECLGKKVDARSDIFSLGIIFWEVLTRRHLFKRKLDLETLRAVVSSKVPPVRTFNKDVSVGLDAVVLRALEKDPADRYPTAADMGIAIREHLRRSKTMAGGKEIRSFYMSVLADRMDTKRRLLKKLEESEEMPAFVAALKADTDKALMLSTHPVEMKAIDAEDASEEPTDVSSLMGRPPKDSIIEPGRTKPQESPEPEEPTETTEVTETTETTERSKFPEPDVKPEKRKAVLAWASVPKDLVSRAVEYSLPILVGLILSFAFVTIVVKCPARDDSSDRTTKAAVEPVPFGVSKRPAGIPAELSEAMLLIHSRPSGCRVRLNGVNLPGRTPISNVSVEANQEYIVTVLCRRYKRESRRITPKAGERINLSFRPRRSRSPTQHGLLDLNTSPWTEVYLGKRKLGITPLLGHKLPAGKHKLRLVNKKWGITKTLSVTITAGKTTKLVKKLEK